MTEARSAENPQATFCLESSASRVRRGVPEKPGKYNVILPGETGLLGQLILQFPKLLGYYGTDAIAEKFIQQLSDNALTCLTNLPIS